MVSGPITRFVENHFRHFNAAVLKDAAQAYSAHLERGGKMFLTLAGAMSTAEIGILLSEMIRQKKVHAICCTGANLEEDVFNLVAHKQYRRIPNWRELTPEEELQLYNQHLNRVTDTCIPEEEAMRKIERFVLEEWKKADKNKESYFPHEFLFQILKNPELHSAFQISPQHSWVYTAMEQQIPLFVPGWEDSTLGNMYAAHCMNGNISSVHTVRNGIEYMIELANWYSQESAKHPIGFFQIGGGIAGDFPICVVPMLHQDLKRENVPLWAYFCQISDSTTSYGSYSGAAPSEKITWGKLGVDTPKFVIESDATLVAPLIFAYVLGM